MTLAERLKHCYWAAHTVQPRTSRGEFFKVMAEKLTDSLIGVGSPASDAPPLPLDRAT